MRLYRLPRSIAVAALCLITAIGIVPGILTAQGLLTPPGTPAPTMKTLDQIEARTPISSLPFTISAAGSYYFTGNLTATANGTAITVTSDNVTIDLNSFTLASGGKTGTAINVSGTRQNVSVRNGTIRDWSGYGIAGLDLTGGHFEKLNLISNASGGIYAGSGSDVRACVATGNSQSINAGILVKAFSTITDCTITANTNGLSVGGGCTIANTTVSSNTGVGIDAAAGCSIVNCAVSFNGAGISVFGSALISHCSVCYSSNGLGIYSGDDSVITGCTVSNNKNVGIQAGNGNTISNCTVGLNGESGITIVSRGTVTGNTLESNNTTNTTKKAGLVVTGNGNRIENNNFVTNNYAGVFADTGVSGNILIRNTFRGAQYIFPTSNVTGPFVDLSSAGGTITSTNPWANFGY